MIVGILTPIVAPPWRGTTGLIFLLKNDTILSMNIRLKTPEEVAKMRDGGRILATILGELAAMVKPGVTTGELEAHAKKRTEELGALTAFEGYTARGAAPPFPTCVCISVNEEVVHAPALPSRDLREGDIVGLDYGIRYPKEKGLYTDMAVTVGVGTIVPEAMKLITVTRRALMQGLKHVKPGKTVNDISRAIQRFVERNGFSVVRELVGHGVGHAVHEDPRIPNFVDLSMPTVILKEGMCLAIEPMVVAGSPDVETLSDGWTVVTKDKSLSAHFELTVVVTASGYQILTQI